MTKTFQGGIERKKSLEKKGKRDKKKGHDLFQPQFVATPCHTRLHLSEMQAHTSAS
jgi:hypothetical protein